MHTPRFCIKLQLRTRRVHARRYVGLYVRISAQAVLASWWPDWEVPDHVRTVDGCRQETSDFSTNATEGGRHSLFWQAKRPIQYRCYQSGWPNCWKRTSHLFCWWYVRHGRKAIRPPWGSWDRKEAYRGLRLELQHDSDRHHAGIVWGCSMWRQERLYMEPNSVLGVHRSTIWVPNRNLQGAAQSVRVADCVRFIMVWGRTCCDDRTAYPCCSCCGWGPGHVFLGLRRYAG